MKYATVRIGAQLFCFKLRHQKMMLKGEFSKYLKTTNDIMYTYEQQENGIYIVQEYDAVHVEIARHTNGPNVTDRIEALIKDVLNNIGQNKINTVKDAADLYSLEEIAYLSPYLTSYFESKTMQ